MAPLLHYSDDELTKLVDVVSGECACKPNGLWLSHGDSWERACECDFATCHVYQVTLKLNAKLRVISTYDDLVAFDDAFAPKTQPTPVQRIDWAQVMATYDGIQIHNYGAIREAARRAASMEGGRMSWILGFDASCTCIWRCSRAIGRIRKIETRA